MLLALASACSKPQGTAPAPPAPTDVAPVAPPPAATASPEVLPTPTPGAALSAATVSRLYYTRTLGSGEVLRSAAFAPDMSAIASAAGNNKDFDIRLWGLTIGSPVGGMQGHTGIVWQIAFSPDGLWLASVSKDKTVRIWDWRTGTQLHLLNMPDEVSSVAFSPDGQTLAVGGVDGFPNAAVWTYNVNTWQQVLKLQESWNIPEISYAPDGQYILAGGTSRNARIWRASDGAVMATLAHPAQVISVAISPDGSTAVTAGCLASDDANQCTTGGIYIWDMPAGTEVRRLSVPSTWVNDVAFSPDGTLLLAGSRDGWLRAYSTVDWGLIYEQWAAGGIEDLVISPDGRMVATGRADGRVGIWELVQ